METANNIPVSEYCTVTLARPTGSFRVTFSNNPWGDTPIYAVVAWVESLHILTGQGQNVRAVKWSTAEMRERQQGHTIVVKVTRGVVSPTVCLWFSPLTVQMTLWLVLSRCDIFVHPWTVWLGIHPDLCRL